MKETNPDEIRRIVKARKSAEALCAAQVKQPQPKEEVDDYFERGLVDPELSASPGNDVAVGPSQSAVPNIDTQRLDWLLSPSDKPMSIRDEINDDWVVSREQIDQAMGPPPPKPSGDSQPLANEISPPAGECNTPGLASKSLKEPTPVPDQELQQAVKRIIDAIYEKWDIGNYDSVTKTFTAAPLSEIIAQIILADSIAAKAQEQQGDLPQD